MSCSVFGEGRCKLARAFLWEYSCKRLKLVGQYPKVGTLKLVRLSSGSAWRHSHLGPALVRVDVRDLGARVGSSGGGHRRGRRRLPDGDVVPLEREGG
jgi:hypothetical protein